MVDPRTCRHALEQPFVTPALQLRRRPADKGMMDVVAGDSGPDGVQKGGRHKRLSQEELTMLS